MTRYRQPALQPVGPLAAIRYLMPHGPDPIVFGPRYQPLPPGERAGETPDDGTGEAGDGPA